MPPAVAVSSGTALLFLLIGGLLAANVETPLVASIAVSLGLGIVRGCADLEGADFSLAHMLTLAGMSAAVFAAFALAASVTLPMRQFWMIVAARVSGSWLAALGLLFAGWILRYGAQVQ
jgi:hypothetical protein